MELGEANSNKGTQVALMPAANRNGLQLRDRDNADGVTVRSENGSVRVE